MKMLYRKASNLWAYKVIDVSLDDLLRMAQEERGIILSLNENKGQKDVYLSSKWRYNKLQKYNDSETLRHIFNYKYVIIQYDDWIE